ncbi:SGNH/GDSL hydrolase family protein [Parabacteroides sp. AM08-6]|uniref:SGNH/GDSL hydrolase family protein n=1 Tax=Parabacteroides sp. AM08-6 TaxID=2292053 RepID=UPI000EFF80CB|nr:SGNH/GDSL hydrolase family protein [Parabacteroides sp. AM08-6]RHJ86639.1 SGNH/GDSL hydrolase family protein [Parabacteroides sp. AM08-6]
MKKRKEGKYIRYSAFLLSALLLSTDIYPYTSSCMPGVQQEQAAENQWKGKKVAFLGDSITDKIHVGTAKNYWQYLEEMLGLKPFVYGINGHQWTGVLEQAEKLNAEMGNEVDAILIFAGTNDYNAGVPLGEWYSVGEQEVEVSGPKKETRKKRTLQMDENTFRGRINKVMSYLKTNFPTKQIVLLTPIHRGYARFSDDNIQPDESYPNQIGLFVDEYVDVIKEAANVWALPVVDLNSVSGLFPVSDSHTCYFHKEDTDRLHPNADGHYRMAKALMYQLLAFPADFE